MKNARIYDFSIAPGGAFSLNVEGETVRVMTCSGPVELVTEAYRIGPINAGQGQGKSPFKRLTINDKSGVANRGTVIVSSADFIDDRITGEVSIIDGGKARTLNGVAFSAATAVAPVAAQFAFLAIYNPVNSGINAIVNDVIFSSTTAQQIYISISQNVPVGSTAAAVNKSAAYTVAGKCSKYGGAVVNPYNNALFAINSASNGLNRWQLTEPIVIQPGYLIAVQAMLPNTDLSGNFQFWEDSIQ